MELGGWWVDSRSQWPSCAPCTRSTSRSRSTTGSREGCPYRGRWSLACSGRRTRPPPAMGVWFSNFLISSLFRCLFLKLPLTPSPPHNTYILFAGTVLPLTVVEVEGAGLMTRTGLTHWMVAEPDGTPVAASPTKSGLADAVARLQPIPDLGLVPDAQVALSPHQIAVAGPAGVVTVVGDVGGPVVLREALLAVDPAGVVLAVDAAPAALEDPLRGDTGSLRLHLLVVDTAGGVVEALAGLADVRVIVGAGAPGELVEEGAALFAFLAAWKCLGEGGRF